MPEFWPDMLYNFSNLLYNSTKMRVLYVAIVFLDLITMLIDRIKEFKRNKKHDP